MDILYGEFHRQHSKPKHSLLCCLWGIFKNRHKSNATGRIRDESLINQGGRDPNSLQIFNFFVSMEMRRKNQSHVAVHYLR
jgi:hypothetical protein